MESIVKNLRPGWVALAVSVLALIAYIPTLNPSFGFVDKGEMAAVASTLGIAHPSGYPTLMLLGYLFTQIFPTREVVALNVLSALLTATGAGMLTLLFHYLLGQFDLDRSVSKPKGKGKGRGRKGARNENAAETPSDTENTSSGIHAVMAGLAALLTALTATWWNQGNGFEVYSLHAVMMPLVTLLFLRYVDIEAEREREGVPVAPNKLGWWFAFALGLSFTNHLTTVLLAPAFLVHYFWRLGIFLGPIDRWTLRSVVRWLLRLLQRWGFLATGFIVGLLPYLWLPIRASMSPRFNWGDPETLKNFIDHVSGKQYRVWMFNNPDTWREQSAFFFGNLPSELAYVGLILALLGLVFLARRSTRLSVFVALLFVSCVVYSGGYDIMEIGPYYMTAIFAVGIWCLAGLAQLRRMIGTTSTVVAALALVVLSGAINYGETNESGNMLVEDMTVNMLTTVPKDALVLSGQWDFWVAGSFYMQAVEGMRPDVLVVDPELLRRSWYIRQLETGHPEFTATVRAEIDRFLPELDKFEHDLPYDPNEIEGAYVSMIRAMIDHNIDRRPVCVTGEVRPEFSAGYVRTPYYLTLLLSRDTTYVPMAFPSYRFRFWNRVDGYTAKAYELYARSALGRIIYERQHGHDSLAARYVDLALSFDPGFKADEVPSLPLNSEEQVTGMIDFFAKLHRDFRR